MSRLLTVVGIVLWLAGLGALAWSLMVGWAAQSPLHEIYAGVLFLSCVTAVGLGALAFAAAWLVPRFEKMGERMETLDSG